MTEQYDPENFPELSSMQTQLLRDFLWTNKKNWPIELDIFSGVKKPVLFNLTFAGIVIEKNGRTFMQVIAKDKFRNIESDPFNILVGDTLSFCSEEELQTGGITEAQEEM